MQALHRTGRGWRKAEGKLKGSWREKLDNQAIATTACHCVAWWALRKAGEPLRFILGHMRSHIGSYIEIHIEIHIESLMRSRRGSTLGAKLDKHSSPAKLLPHGLQWQKRVFQLKKFQSQHSMLNMPLCSSLAYLACEIHLCTYVALLCSSLT